MAKKLIGTYENPTKNDIDRILVDIEMAKKAQELQSKGFKLMRISKPGLSREQIKAEIVESARTGRIQF